VIAGPGSEDGSASSTIGALPRGRRAVHRLHRGGGMTQSCPRMGARGEPAGSPRGDAPMRSIGVSAAGGSRGGNRVFPRATSRRRGMRDRQWSLGAPLRNRRRSGRRARRSPSQGRQLVESVDELVPSEAGNLYSARPLTVST
jgi:hypothetical protein